MPVTLTVPDDLKVQLRRVAAAQHRAAEEVAVEILRTALLDASLVLNTAVGGIRRDRANSAGIRPARDALLDALPAGEADGSLDSAAWEAAWAVAEAEMAALTHADDRADGRR